MIIGLREKYDNPYKIESSKKYEKGQFSIA